MRKLIAPKKPLHVTTEKLRDLDQDQLRSVNGGTPSATRTHNDGPTG